MLHSANVCHARISTLAPVWPQRHTARAGRVRALRPASATRPVNGHPQLVPPEVCTCALCPAASVRPPSKHSALAPVARRVCVARAALLSPGTVDRPLPNQEDWYKPGAALERYWGPVEVRHIPGSGRGVVASRDLAAGELVMVSLPLCVAHGEFGEVPDYDSFLDEMASQRTYRSQRLSASSWHSCSRAEAAAVRCLYNGEDESLQALPDFRTLWSSDDALGGDAGLGGLHATCIGIAEGKIEQMASLNWYGEEHPDLPPSLARGDRLDSLLGVWPEFSFLNHSCCPNSTQFVVADAMVVRAARPVEAGEQLTINYLGASNMRPIDERQALLSEGYAFTCECARCQAELESELLHNRLLQVEAFIEGEVVPRVQGALQSRDKGDMREIRNALMESWADFEEALDKSGVDDLARSWLRASSFELPRLTLFCEQQLELGEPPRESEKALKALMHVVADVAPLSDLHFLLAIRHLSLAQLWHGVHSPEAAKAHKRAEDVTRLRFGVSSPEAVQKLMVKGSQALDMVEV